MILIRNVSSSVSFYCSKTIPRNKIITMAKLSSFRSASLSIIYLLLTAPATRGGGEVEHVEGVVGGDLILPCDVIPPIDDRVAVILWYRDNHPDAMYTYDDRNTSLGFRQHTPRDQKLARRTHFQPTPPAHMNITDATLHDAGRYECRVDFMRAPSKTTIVKVTVAEPPTTIRVSEDTGKALTGTVTADEGSPLRLSCIVTGGRPRPRVWWTLRNKTHEIVVDESSESLGSDLTQNELMLPRLTPDHHHTQLTCHAANTNTSLELTERITLLVNMAPQRVVISGLPRIVHAGRQYRAWCDTYGSRPAPTLIWSITRPERLEEMLDTQVLSKRNVTRSSLPIQVQWSDHGAILRCSAFSPALKDRIVSNSSMFDVHYPPLLHLALGRMLQPDDIKEEMDVYFLCSITANPKVYKVTWYHNDQVVSGSSSEGVIVSDDHLVLQGITRRWSGTFQCRASNVVGDASSNTLNITVQFAPLCAASAAVVYRAALGEEITLPCRVLSHPPNVTFSWTFMNALTEERVPGHRVSWKGLESRLRYLPEKTQDYGTLHCWATNVVGHQHKPCVFTVKPAGVPSPPINCTVSNQTWESVEVTCGDQSGLVESRGSGHGAMVHVRGGQDSMLGLDSPPPGDLAELLQDSDKPRYLITVKERYKHMVVHNVSHEGGVISVQGLTPGLDYVISVHRFNSHGRSPPVTLEAFTLKTAENRMREDGGSGDSAVLGVVVGVMGVVFLLAVAAIVLTLRSRVRPRPTTPTQSTRLPHTDTLEGSLGGGLDHPDLLESESHVPAPGYRAAEVTQALLATSRPHEDELSLSSTTPTATHLNYLGGSSTTEAAHASPCTLTPSHTPTITPSVTPHPRLYVRAEGHASQQESFL